MVQRTYQESMGQMRKFCIKNPGGFNCGCYLVDYYCLLPVVWCRCNKVRIEWLPYSRFNYYIFSGNFKLLYVDVLKICGQGAERKFVI